jgi:hypothetical protein
MEPAVEWLHIIKELGDDIYATDDRDNIFKDLRVKYLVLNEYNISNWVYMRFEICSAFGGHIRTLSYILSTNKISYLEEILCFIMDFKNIKIDLKHNAALALHYQFCVE